MTWFGRTLSAGAVVLAAWAGSAPAEAGTVAIGLQIGNGAIVTPAASIVGGLTTLSLSSMGGFGIAASGRGAVLGVSPELFADTLATALAAAGTLRLYVSETDIAPSPSAAPQTLASDFSASLHTKGWTVTEATYLDAADARYGTATPLSSASFAASGSAGRTERVTLPDAPYALTEVFTLRAGGAGAANLAIDFGPAPLGGTIPTSQSVPEPAGPAVLALGLAGLAAVRRRHP